MFAMIKEVEGVQANAEMVAFIDHEIELLSHKGKSENTKKAKEMAENVAIVKSALASVGKPVTVTELIKASSTLSDFSNQKVSAMLKKLVDAGEVKKDTDKKVSTFSLATEVEEQ